MVILLLAAMASVATILTLYEAYYAPATALNGTWIIVRNAAMIAGGLLAIVFCIKRLRKPG